MPNPEMKEYDQGLRFFMQFDIARKDYVAARVCLQTDLFETGMLLSQQCIEAYSKAIMLLNPEHYYFSSKKGESESQKIRAWGHELVELVENAGVHNPSLKGFLNDENRRLLKDLSAAYEPVRYGEATFENLDKRTLSRQLDTLVSFLDDFYLSKINVPRQAKLFVPDSLKQDFLRENQAFRADRVSSNLMSNYLAAWAARPPYLPH